VVLVDEVEQALLNVLGGKLVISVVLGIPCYLDSVFEFVGVAFTGKVVNSAG